MVVDRRDSRDLAKRVEATAHQYRLSNTSLEHLLNYSRPITIRLNEDRQAYSRACYQRRAAYEHQSLIIIQPTDPVVDNAIDLAAWRKMTQRLQLR